MKRKILFSLKLVGAALLPCLFSVNAFALSVIPGQSYEYIACPSTKVALDIVKETGQSCMWYSAKQGGKIIGSADTMTVYTKTAADIDTVWLQIGTQTRIPVPIYLSHICGSTSDATCAGGTILFKEDFGGNNPSDPAEKSTGIPQVSYTYDNGMYGWGLYSIRKESHLHPGGIWYSSDDHTFPDDPTRGYLMQVDATEAPGQFYSYTLKDICPGSHLTFSCWMKSLMNNLNYPSKANVIFELLKPNGDMVAKYYSGDIPDQDNTWKQYGFDFFSPSGSDDLELKIINNGTGSHGNDFVMDDIEIRLCVPPISASISPNDTVCLGSPVSINSQFENNGVFAEPLAYKWFKKVNATDSWTELSTNTPDLTFNSVSQSDQGYYRVAVSSTGSIESKNCRAMSDSVYLKVVMPPTLSSTLTPSAICSNTTFKYTATSASAGATFSWSRAAVSGISNAAANGRTGSISETLVNTTANPIVVTYKVTSVVNGCSSSTSDVRVTVNPQPTVTIQGNDNYCPGDAGTYKAIVAFNGEGVGTPAYNWSLKTGSASSVVGSTQTINAVSITSPSTYSVTVNYAGGCTATATKDITTNCCTYKIGDVSPKLICGTTAATKEGCGESDFMLPIDAVVNVNPGTIGMDICLKYDKRYLTPSGCAELGEVVKTSKNYSAGYFLNVTDDILMNSTDDVNTGYLHISIYYDKSNSIKTSGTTNTYPTFSGIGNVIKVGFKVNGPIPQNYKYTFDVCEIWESLELSERAACIKTGDFTPQNTYEYDGKIVYGLSQNTANPSAELPIQTINSASKTTVTTREYCGFFFTPTTQDLTLNSNGEFSLLNVPYANAAFELNRDIINSKNSSSYFNVVNSMDARYAGFITTMNNKALKPTSFQMIAADVNLSDMVRANDISLIQFRSVGKIKEYPQNGRQENSLAGLDWRFVPESELTNPVYTISASYPLKESANANHYWRDNVPNVSSCFTMKSCAGQNKIYGIMLGDVYRDPSKDKESIFKDAIVSDKSYKIDMSGIVSQGDGKYLLPIKYESLNDSALGIDLVLQLSSDVTVLDVQAPSEFTESHLVWNVVEDNTLLATNYTLGAWPKSGTAFNVLVSKANGDSISEKDVVLSYGYINDNKVDLNLYRSGVASVSATTISSSGLSLSVLPNPISTQGQIKYTIDDEASVNGYEISIYNSAGTSIAKYGNLTKEGSVSISSKLSSGVYLCVLRNNAIGKSKVVKFSVK